MLTLMPRAGVGAAWKVAAVEAGSTVAVFGLGTVGLAVMTPNPATTAISTTFFFLSDYY
jgi:Zn-dependent alcohol dehydrogenase